jgi:hypothetical protein
MHFSAVIAALDLFAASPQPRQSTACGRDGMSDHTTEYVWHA